MIFGIGVWVCMDSALFQNDGGTAAFHGVTHMDRWICMDRECVLRRCFGRCVNLCPALLFNQLFCSSSCCWIAGFGGV